MARRGRTDAFITLPSFLLLFFSQHFYAAIKGGKGVAESAETRKETADRSESRLFRLILQRSMRKKKEID